MSKGSKRRPSQVPDDKVREEWDRLFAPIVRISREEAEELYPPNAVPRETKKGEKS